MVKNLVDLIFPNRCFACNKILVQQKDILCISCMLKLPFSYDYLTINNSLKNEISKHKPIEYAFSLFYYTKHGLGQQLIREIKYNNKPRIGKLLGENLAIKIKENFNHNPLDYIIYIPTSRSRKYKRGYNQVESFANAMSEVLNVPILDGVVKRLQEKESQVNKNKVERFINLENAFETNSIYDLNKKHILLLDDVFTTGATIVSCINSIEKVYDVKFSLAVMAYNK